MTERDDTIAGGHEPVGLTKRGERMKRIITLVAGVLLVLAMMAAPASAHVLIVDPPGADEPKSVWVGGPALPAEGNGLYLGGPTGTDYLPPSHDKGLNVACEVQRQRGNSAADMWGPPNPGTCAHGGPPPGP